MSREPSPAVPVPLPPVVVMLVGEFQQKIDEKGRLVLPASFRDELSATTLMLAVGPFGELGLWPEAEFKRRSDQLAEREYTSGEATWEYRTFMANSARVKLDGQSRIALSETVRRKGGFDGNLRDVVINGVGSRAEIWEKSRWEHFQTTRGAMADA